jgi:hypothetical protein
MFTVGCLNLSMNTEIQISVIFVSTYTDTLEEIHIVHPSCNCCRVKISLFKYGCICTATSRYKHTFRTQFLPDYHPQSFPLQSPKFQIENST